LFISLILGLTDTYVSKLSALSRFDFIMTTKQEHTSAIEVTQGLNSFTYAINLPGTDAQLPLSFFKGKHDILGQFAVVEQVGKDMFEAVRDPLGIGKIFYTQTQDGSLQFSGQFRMLLTHKTPIFALPRGQHVRLAPNGVRELLGRLAPTESEVQDSLSVGIADADQFHASVIGRQFKSDLTTRLNAAFTVLKQLELNGFSVFIALSGGLDSSIIAAMARKYLSNPVACTLDLGRSEDAEKSALIAREIDIERVVFSTSEDEILAAISESPVVCQDYRDFNVHCTALNLLLAKNIRAIADKRNVPQNKAIILTGDTMNEFTCDYAAEVIDGKEYYRLPRVNKKMLQHMLIGGLDTSDREVLPFNKYNLACVQPFAATYDLYLRLPESVLQIADVKRVLNGHLVPEAVLRLLPRSKLRAQVGSKETMGVLGLCHRMGITEHSFLQQLLGNTNPSKADVPITMGRYEVEEFSGG